jgi:subtilase family serine protease
MHAQTLGAASQSATTHFNIYFPLTHQDTLEKLLNDQTTQGSASYHQWLTPAQFKAQFGPNASDVAKVKAELQSAGFTILSERTQSIEVQGSVSAVEKMFATRLQQKRTSTGHAKFSASDGGHLTLPGQLAAMGVVIPEFAPHLAHVHSQRMGKALAAAYPTYRLTSNDSFYYPDDMREAYQAPSFLAPISRHQQLTGAGSTIGIVISSVISPADVAATFNSTVPLSNGEQLIQAYSKNTKVPVPTVTIDPVDGGSGPFDASSDDAFEASLDTQMSLGTAPGAKEILYNIPDLYDDSILDGYAQIDEENRVDVVSSSFGQCELYYTAAFNGGVDYTSILKTYHSLFQQGNAQGITFLASSGDNGALECIPAGFWNNPANGYSYVPGVSTPAADPNVTAVGGTNLQTSAAPGVDDAAYLSENANYDPRVPAEFQLDDGSIVSVTNNTWGSGGGFSTIFSKPAYQYLVDTGSNKQRALPDVSLMMGGCPGDADLTVQDCTTLPRSAALTWVGGDLWLLIGTSSSSPQFAGVLALAVEENHGRLGNVNPLIYSLSAVQTLLGGSHAPKPFQYFHRTISGNNNYYKVKPGQSFSEVLGNSTLDIQNFLQLQLAPTSGAPNTASNP